MAYSSEFASLYQDTAFLREVYFQGSSPATESQFVSNEVSGDRFALWTFIPRSLSVQFKSNPLIWYSIVSILTLTPLNTDDSNIWCTLIPFGLTVVVGLLKSGLQDLRSRRQKNSENEKLTQVWNGEKFVEIKWRDVKVGHIVHISEDEVVPADLILITSSSPETCFDKELITGSKVFDEKFPVKELHIGFTLAEVYEVTDVYPEINKLEGIMQVPVPSSDMLDFRGRIKLPKSLRVAKLKNKNFVPRGYILRKTPWIIGVAVYTGKEAKIWQIYKASQAKSGLFSTTSNLWTLIILAVLIFFSCVGFLLNYQLAILRDENLKEAAALFMAYNIFVPMSYILVTDLIKFIISREETLKSRGCFINRVDCVENLGSIDYVFTGKNNCITSPGEIVQFIVIDSTVYNNFNHSSHKELSIDSPLAFSEIGFDFKDLFNVHLKENDPNVRHFLHSIMLCNNLKLDHENPVVKDDVLINLAKQFEMELHYKDDNLACLQWRDIKTDYSVIAYQPYSAENRRTRIILKEMMTNEAVLYVKGEPQVMFSVFNLPRSKRKELKRILKSQLAGVRHVLLGYKILSAEELLEFSSAFELISLTPINKEARLENLFVECESDLNYIGILGIEHHIPPSTSESISCLLKGGVKFWMLTGDTESSSISAALGSGIIMSGTPILTIDDIQTEHECLLKLEEITYSLIDQNFDNFSSMESDRVYSSEIEDDSKIIEEDSVNDKESSIEKSDHKKTHRRILTMALKHLKSTFGQLRTQRLEFNKPLKLASEYNVSLCIDGYSLDFAFKSLQTRKLLVILLNIARSVVFYNMLPYQKRQVVRLVKNNFTKKAQVLAVGGDLEDIPMLREADVSVNFIDQKSIAPVDIAISSFSKLKYVILCLGHWTYGNIITVTALSFYNSSLIGLTSFLYFFYANYTASTILNTQYQFVLLYLLLLFPAISLGAWDKDAEIAELLQNEDIYKEPKEDTKRFLWTLMEQSWMGAIHGVISFYLLVNSCQFLILDGGYAADSYFMENLLFISIYVTGLLKTYSLIHKKSVKTLSGFCLSLLAFFSFCVIRRSFEIENVTTLNELFEQLLFTLILVLIVSTNYAVQLMFTMVCKLYSRLPRVHGTTAAFINSMIESNINDFFKDSSDWRRVEEKYNFEMNKYTQRFQSVERENNYCLLKLNRQHKSYSIFFVLLLLFFIVIQGWNIIFDYSYEAVVLNSVSIAFLCSYLTLHAHFFNKYKEFTLSYFFVLCVLLVFLHVSLSTYSSLTAPLFFVLVLLSHNINWVHSIMTAGIQLLITLLSSALSFPDAFVYATLAEYAAHLIAFVLCCGVVSYKLETSQRDEFIVQQKLELEAQKVHSVLSCLLPAFVKKRVKEGVRYIAEDQGTVTVIFCNICDFISLVEYFSPQELTAFLDECFRKLDLICDSVGVTKIETVGYTYMACVGLKDSDAEISDNFRSISQARRAIEFGLLVLGAVNNIRLHSGKTLEMKIGINSGPVAAGVVGSQKPQFSLVGDTVNTASRMASTASQSNMLQFSEATMHILKEREGLVFKTDKVFVKGKDEMKVYRISLADFRQQELNQQLSSPGPKNKTIISKVSTHSVSMHESMSVRKCTVYKMLEVSNTLEFIQKNEIRKFVENIQVFRFRFQYSENDSLFRVTNIKKTFLIFFAGLSIKAILEAITLGVFITQKFEEEINWSSIGLVGVYFLGYLLGVFLMKGMYKSAIYAWVMQFLVISDSILTVFHYLPKGAMDLPAAVILFVYNLLLLTHCSLLLFNEASFTAICASLTWAFVYFELELKEFIISAIAVVFTGGLMILLLYRREKTLRFIRNLEHTGNKEINETEELLVKMFPPQIYNELKNDTIDINKFYSTTLLYADIVGFTAWSSNKKPREVVEQLSYLFTKFDELCKFHNVYKVHTIGDCYVVMGYENINNLRDPGQEALNVVDFAHSMISVIHEVNAEMDCSLDMRIGIHTGDIVGGITGSNIVRYDIYGIDVLIANNIESNGLPGEIAVSHYTKILLENFRPSRFKFEYLNDFVLHDNEIQVLRLVESA